MEYITSHFALQFYKVVVIYWQLGCQHFMVTFFSTFCSKSANIHGSHFYCNMIIKSLVHAIYYFCMMNFLKLTSQFNLWNNLKFATQALQLLKGQDVHVSSFWFRGYMGEGLAIDGTVYKFNMSCNVFIIEHRSAWNDIKKGEYI